MEIEITETKKVIVKYIKAEAGVRHWEDATVNGVEDAEGDLIPMRVKDYWCPIIDLNTGFILDWPSGVTADIHYKVCDDGTYHLLDENKEIVKTIEGYVPNIMSPSEVGYGDYIIMNVDAEGHIDKWRVTLSEFTDED